MAACDGQVSNSPLFLGTEQLFNFEKLEEIFLFSRKKWEPE